MQSEMSISSWTLGWQNALTSFLHNYEPSNDCAYVQK